MRAWNFDFLNSNEFYFNQRLVSLLWQGPKLESREIVWHLADSQILSIVTYVSTLNLWGEFETNYIGWQVMSYGSDGSYKMSGRTFFFFRKPKDTETNLEQLNRYWIKAFLFLWAIKRQKIEWNYLHILLISNYILKAISFENEIEKFFLQEFVKHFPRQKKVLIRSPYLNIFTKY